MTTLKRILCPVDFSEQSAHTLSYAVNLAQWLGAQVTPLYVHPMPWPIVGIGPYVEPAIPLALTEQERAALAASLTRFADAAAVPGVTIATAVTEDVDVAAGILARAVSLPADLIVIGTHGRSGFERFVLGSVAERVLRKASCPVLTVPPHTPSARLAAPGTMHRVLCAVDFSPSSGAALRWASALAVKAGARATVVHVAEMPLGVPEPPSPQWSAYRDYLVGDATRGLRALVPHGVTQPGLEERIAVGRPHEEILRLAEQEQADLIVMGVRGRGAVDMAMFGSVAQQVVRRSACPVLAVHPDPA